MNYYFINQLCVFFIIIMGLFLGFWVYLANPKKKLHKIFFVFTIFLILWTSYPFFFNLSGLSDNLSLLLVRLAYGTTALFLIPFYYFVIYFPKKNIKYSILGKIVISISSLLFIFSSFTNYHVKGIIREKWGIAPLFGEGKLIYFGFISLLVAMVIYLIFKKYITLNKKEKLKIQYVLIGLSIFIILNSVFNILIPTFLGTLKYYPIGNYSAIIFLGFTAFAIVKRKLFEIRVVFTTLFVSLIAILLFVDAVIFTENFSYQLLKGSIFILFIFFGYSLVKSVIREIKYREALEKAYEELKRLDTAKSEFISIASHQLRTPLSAIKGYLSMVLENSYGAVPKKMEKPINNVYDSSERLIRLVNDLLSVSRIEAGRLEMSFDKADIEKTLSSVSQELKNEAELKGIKVIWEEPKNSLPEIMIDEEKVRQIFLNLIDNAIKYTKEGSVIMKAIDFPSKIQIIVSDTGDGISKEEMSKMFKSFSRGSAGNKSYVEGVGLGLYIARKFTDLHKGKIWAESKGKGKGTTFYVELPKNLKN